MCAPFCLSFLVFLSECFFHSSPGPSTGLHLDFLETGLRDSGFTPADEGWGMGSRRLTGIRELSIPSFYLSALRGPYFWCVVVSLRTVSVCLVLDTKAGGRGSTSTRSVDLTERGTVTPACTVLTRTRGPGTRMVSASPSILTPRSPPVSPDGRGVSRWGGVSREITGGGSETLGPHDKRGGTRGFGMGPSSSWSTPQCVPDHKWRAPSEEGGIFRTTPPL